MRRRGLGARKGGARGAARRAAAGHVRADLRAGGDVRRPAAGLQVPTAGARGVGYYLDYPAQPAARVLRARRRGPTRRSTRRSSPGGSPRRALLINACSIRGPGIFFNSVGPTPRAIDEVVPRRRIALVRGAAKAPEAGVIEDVRTRARAFGGGARP